MEETFRKDYTNDDICQYLNVEESSLWLIQAVMSYYKKTAKEEMCENYFKKLMENSTGPDLYHYMIICISKLLDIPIFTTNYDDLFERAHQDLGFEDSLLVISQENDIQKDEISKTDIGYCLIYLHGKLNQSALVASEYDYLSIINNNENKILSLFKNHLNKRLVFLWVIG